MDSDLRAPLIAAAAAAVVSSLVGVFSRVGFTALAIRALLFGVFFGGLTWGALVLLKRFLPELFEGEAAVDGFAATGFAEGSAAEGESMGGTVDIVLDEDGEPFLNAAPAPLPVDGEDEDGEKVDIAEDADVETAVLSEDGGEAVLDVAESRPKGRPAVPLAGAMPSRQASGVDDLDVLPDLDSLSGSFVDSATDSSYSSAKGGASSSDSRGSSGKAANGADPATLALAVRTLLKRDQKG